MKQIACLLVLVISAFTYGHNGTSDVFKETVITPQISMLQGKGGNIAVLKGNNSYSIIDDDYQENDAALNLTLKKLVEREVNDGSDVRLDYVFNTHWHRDHTGGNELLGTTATIVSHENVRKRLSAAQTIKLFNMSLPPLAESGWPKLTYQKQITFHLYGLDITLVHYPKGHTDGDSVIFIQSDNVVHMGDHYFRGRFPFIDVENGGDINGMIANIESILTQIDEETVVIPGHGALSNKRELTEYHQMLIASRDFAKTCLSESMSLDQCQKKGFGEQFESWGQGFINPDTWIKIVYSNLKSR